MKTLILLITLLTASITYAQPVIYVHVNGTGNGASWSNACSLEQAMTLAASGTQVWVQQGIYYPAATLQVPAGVQLYGGFVGNEMFLSQRNYAKNPTIIDGQQRFSVVRLGDGSVLNGFTIQNGKAYSKTPDGGGIWMGHHAEVSNCYILDNTADAYGGGIFAVGDGIVFGTVITRNKAGKDGLAIYGTTLDVRNVTVTENDFFAVAPPPSLPASCNSNTPNWGASLGKVSFATENIWLIAKDTISQVWSDAVRTTNCSSRGNGVYKGGSSDNYNADCRSNPSYKGDLFSWCAVMRFADSLCPAPWRVPTQTDFVNLDIALGGNGLDRINDNTALSSYINSWGGALSGCCSATGGLIDQNKNGDYWSQTEYNPTFAHFLLFNSSATIHPHHADNKHYGIALRCVRDTTLPPKGCNNNKPNYGNTLGAVTFVGSDITISQNGVLQVWSGEVTTTVCAGRTTYSGGSSGNYNADCRSNPNYDGDLFTWCTVARFSDSLCPAPWRVPTKQDFTDLYKALGAVYDNYSTLWGMQRTGATRYGGDCSSSGYLNDQGTGSRYWSQEQANTNSGYYFNINPDGINVHAYYMNEGFSLRCVRDSILPSAPSDCGCDCDSVILDVSLENLTDGLIDRSVYKHPQVGGTTGVEAYSEGGIKLLARNGIYAFPKWDINKTLLPLVIEYDVKRFSDVPGHGDFAFFIESETPNKHFNQALTSWRANPSEFSPMHSTYFSPWPSFSPTVAVNEWVKVRVEYGKPNAGTGEIKTYFNGVLQSTITIPSNYDAIPVKKFLLAQDWLSAHDVANAAFRNLKIWVPKEQRDYSLILDVSLENLEDGLIDRSIYSHLQIGGITGVTTYSEGGIMMTGTNGTKPRWRINKSILPLTIEYDVKYFGIRGHGECMCFMNANDATTPMFAHALSGGGKNIFDGAFFWFNQQIPALPTTVWTKVRVEYGEPVSGTVEAKIFYDDVLQSTKTFSHDSELSLEDFCLYHREDNSFNTANAAFKNLKIWIPNKQPDSTLILDVSLENLTNGLCDRSVYKHPQTGGTTGVSEYDDSKYKGIMMNSGAGTKPRWDINKEIFPLVIEYDAKNFGIRGHGWCMEFRNADNTNWIFGHALSFAGFDRFLATSNIINSDFITPSLTKNQWVNVRVEYGKPICGIGEVKIYLNGILQKTMTCSYSTQVCSNFSLRYQSDDNINNANAAFRNLKIWIPKEQPDSTLILDVSLKNLSDGLCDRSIYRKSNEGGITGVSEYSEGGLTLNLTGGTVPKWEFNRPIAGVTYEFEAKLFSKSRGHGRIVCFVKNPEVDYTPGQTCLSAGKQDKINALSDICNVIAQPSIPLNVWTKIRIEITHPTDGKVTANLYLNDVLKASDQFTDTGITFPHFSIGGDFGFAYHDRANAAIRNLRVWVVK